MPWKLPCTVLGMPMAASAAWLSTATWASLSDLPGARLNEMVEATAWSWWFTEVGEAVGVKLAMADSGTMLGHRADRDAGGGVAARPGRQGRAPMPGAPARAVAAVAALGARAVRVGRPLRRSRSPAPTPLSRFSAGRGAGSSTVGAVVVVAAALLVER